MFTYSFTVKGTAPMITHNGDLANPLLPGSRTLKELTSKRGKTESDIRAIAEVEWNNGFYLNAKGEPCIPSRVLRAAFLAGAKKSKQGVKFSSGVYILDDAQFDYSGPKTPAEMFAQGGLNSKFVHQCMENVNSGKVLRTRPIFHDWTAKFDLLFDPDVIDGKDVFAAVEACGRLIGFGDKRPQFGRFSIAKHSLSE